MTWRTYARTVFWSVDFAVAIIVVVATVLLMSGEEVRSGGRTALIASGALGLGLLAIVLAGMTLVATFMDNLYRRVLEGVPGGFRGALLPFKVVAVLSGATALQSVLGTVMWKGLSESAREIILISTAGTACWAIVGAVQLVFITSWHGEKRARLLEIIGNARREVRQRRATPVRTEHL